MLNERKIDSFFNKKKRSTRGVLEKPEKSYSNFESTCGSKQTLTKLKIEKKLLEFDFNPRYGPSYGIIYIIDSC